MGFPALTSATARWRPVSGPGLEHLDLRRDGDNVIADGVIVGGRDAKPYGVHYRIVCDAGWRTRRLHIHTTTGLSLDLAADGNARWSDNEGKRLPQLDGCIDVDLAGSPFTNTLPIRRLELKPEDGASELSMVYIPFGTFEPTVDGQRYRCLEADALYRYEAADRSFTADLPVDRDGLVIDYPSLFVRADL
jgi:uncharacterized protein